MNSGSYVSRYCVGSKERRRKEILSHAAPRGAGLRLGGIVARVSDVAWEMDFDWPNTASLFFLTRYLIRCAAIW